MTATLYFREARSAIHLARSTAAPRVRTIHNLRREGTVCFS